MDCTTRPAARAPEVTIWLLAALRMAGPPPPPSPPDAPTPADAHSPTPTALPALPPPPPKARATTACPRTPAAGTRAEPPFPYGRPPRPPLPPLAPMLTAP